MQRFYPSIYSLIGLLAFIAMWLVYLFTVQPECFDSFQSALDSARFALNPNESGSWLFICTLLSMLMCLLCIILFLYPKYSKVCIFLVIVHVFVAFMFYTPVFVLLIALPLLSWRQVFKMPNKTKQSDA